MVKHEQIGIWIDNDILFADLTITEKLILADIVSLSKGKNVYVKSNDSIARFTNVSIRTINYTIKSLIDKDLIVSKITYPYGNIKKKRVITPNWKAIKMIRKPIVQKLRI